MNVSPFPTTRIELPADGPGAQAGSVLVRAQKLYAELIPAADAERFVNGFAASAVRGELPSGDELDPHFASQAGAGNEVPAVVAAILMCIADAGRAVRAEHDGHIDRAWAFAGCALYRLGIAVGIASTLTDAAREHYQAWTQKRRASKRWEESWNARRWARAEYENTRTVYKGKADWARITGIPHVREHFKGVQVNERTMVEDWLRGL